MAEELTIEEIEKRHIDEWVAVEVTAKEKGEPVKGKVLFHSKNKKEVWANVPPSKGKEIYIFYTGEPIEEGYIAAFFLKYESHYS